MQKDIWEGQILRQYAIDVKQICPANYPSHNTGRCVHIN